MEIWKINNHFFSKTHPTWGQRIRVYYTLPTSNMRSADQGIPCPRPTWGQRIRLSSSLDPSRKYTSNACMYFYVCLKVQLCLKSRVYTWRSSVPTNTLLREFSVSVSGFINPLLHTCMARVIVVGLSVFQCVCVSVRPPFFSDTAEALSVKHAYVIW